MPYEIVSKNKAIKMRTTWHTWVNMWCALHGATLQYKHSRTAGTAQRYLVELPLTTLAQFTSRTDISHVRSFLSVTWPQAMVYAVEDIDTTRIKFTMSPVPNWSDIVSVAIADEAVSQPLGNIGPEHITQIDRAAHSHSDCVTMEIAYGVGAARVVRQYTIVPKMFSVEKFLLARGIL